MNKKNHLRPSVPRLRDLFRVLSNFLGAGGLFVFL